MDFETVESLRDDLLLRLNLRPQAGIRPSPGMGRRTLQIATPGHPIALGVAYGNTPDEFKMAIRLQGDRQSSRELVAEIVDTCRGEVDVADIGVLELHSISQLQSVMRPMMIGGSVSCNIGGTGTIGLITYSMDRKQRFILSNNHVLAGSNTVAIGADVMQPGIADGGNITNRVGSLANFFPVNTTAINYIDASIAEIDPLVRDMGNRILSWGQITGVAHVPRRTCKAYKLGRTTGLTDGFIAASGLKNIAVRWQGSTAWFDNCIEIVGNRSVFSKPGDSGSTIFSESGTAFGLLFAGVNRHGVARSYANELTTVMNSLGLVI